MEVRAVTTPAVPVMASNASDVRVFMVVAFHGPNLVSAQIYKTKSPDASILGYILHKKFRSVHRSDFSHNIKYRSAFLYSVSIRIIV